MGIVGCETIWKSHGWLIFHGVKQAPVEASLVIDRRDEAMSYFEQVILRMGWTQLKTNMGFNFDGIQWDFMEFNGI